MTRPETCGAAGGAISVWLNILDCSGPQIGIVTSRTSHSLTHSRIECRNNELR